MGLVVGIVYLIVIILFQAFYFTPDSAVSLISFSLINQTESKILNPLL